MKLIQINNAVTLTTDSIIPSGSIVNIYQGGENVFDKQIIKGNEYISYTVIFSLFISLGAFVKGSKPQPSNTIKDFGTTINTYISVTDYENESSENNLINIVYDYLNTIYPNKITIIQI